MRLWQWHQYPCTKRVISTTRYFLFDKALYQGKLEYLHTSLYSAPSIAQPSSGSYIVTAACKWSWNPDLRDRTNTENKHMGFLKLVKLDRNMLKIIAALQSNVLTNCNESCELFRHAKNIMRLTTKNVSIDEDMIDDHDSSTLVKWTQVAMCRFVASEDEELLAKLRREITSNTPLSHGSTGAPRFDMHDILALIEFLHPIQVMTCFTNSGSLPPHPTSLYSIV